jgi:hypothetical protein
VYRSGSTNSSISYTEYYGPTVGVRKARCILNRDTHVIFRARPWFEVNRIRFEIISNAFIKLGQERTDLVVGWYH